MSLLINEKHIGSKHYHEYKSPEGTVVNMGVYNNQAFHERNGVNYITFDGTNTFITGLVVDDLIIAGELSVEGNTDITGTLDVTGDTTVADITVDTMNVTEEITLAPNASPSSTAGTLYYDAESQTVSAKTGVANVSVQIGQEMQYQVVNNTGVQIDNGTPVYAAGVDATTELIEIGPANANSAFTSLSTLGLTTEDIADGEVGMVTNFGIVRDFDTSGLSPAGAMYLDSSPGGMTNTKPLSPNRVILLGTCLVSDVSVGKVHVARNIFSRAVANKSYSFTSNGIGSGTYYVGGFYDAPVADTTLTNASLTQTHGSADNAYWAHAFIVAGAAGTVDTGQVGLKVTGDSVTDAGVLVEGDEEILTTDITTLATNSYLESPKKWVGTCTFTLYTVSGSPTTYTVDFNYGYCKYEDFGNKDFTVNTIEVVGLAGGNDSSFNIQLLKHDDTGWTYHASAFDPGNGIIAEWSTDLGTHDNLVNNENFAWKRSTLAEYIDGSAEEGIIVKIITGVNNSVQTMDVHVVGEIESF